jgi:hypothetical protein
MTGKGSFGPEEWQALVRAGTLVGHSIIIADTPRKVKKEFKALTRAFELTAKNYPGNALIAEVLPEAKKASMVEIDAKAIYSKRDENLAKYLAELHAVGVVLQKADEKESREFKHWLLNIGEATALAVRDEEFASIGMPGDEISRLERKVLRNISKELVLIPYVVDIDPIRK